MNFYTVLFVLYVSIFSIQGYASFSDQKDKVMSIHIKSRLNQYKPEAYPDRAEVPESFVSWSRVFSDYHPVYFTHPNVLNNDRTIKAGGYADPEDITKLKIPGVGFRKLKSLTGTLYYNAKGFPLNPCGRTGISGRGRLGKWGANQAADPIIIRFNPEKQIHEMLAIQRKDNQEWAIPGGMVDDGDTISKTLAKELFEETGINITMAHSTSIYQGYVDDPRNTDNAWMETTAQCLFISYDITNEMKPDCSKDRGTLKVEWKALDHDFIKGLYANHRDFVNQALNQIMNSKLIETTNKNLL